MKVLYVGHTYTVRVNHAKIAALAKEPGVEITLVTPQGWRGPLYENRTDKFDTSLAPNVDHKILHAFFIGKEGTYVYGPSIFRLIARLKPDVVHVEQGAYALSYTEILLALRLFSPKSKAAFFTWWNLPYQAKGIKRITERFNLARSASAIAGNEAAKAILRDHGFERPIHVLPQLGIDLAAYNPNYKSPRSTDGSAPFTIGYAGRIEEEKGVLDLVDAVSAMRNRREALLYFVGNGSGLLEARRRIAYRGLKFIHHAAVRNEELPSRLATMDVLVLPSRTTPTWVEQFGHILIEAMAMGVPVIGSSSGEIPNVIGAAGLVFPEGNTEELAALLDRTFENPQERARIGAAGRKRVEDNFTHDHIASEQMRIYEWMMREGQPVVRRHNPKQIFGPSSVIGGTTTPL